MTPTRSPRTRSPRRGSRPTGRALDADAQDRATEAGPNALSAPDPPKVWRLVLRSATQPFVLVLLVGGRRCRRHRRGPRRPAHPGRTRPARRRGRRHRIPWGACPPGAAGRLRAAGPGPARRPRRRSRGGRPRPRRRRSPPCRGRRTGGPSPVPGGSPRPRSKRPDRRIHPGDDERRTGRRGKRAWRIAGRWRTRARAWSAAAAKGSSSPPAPARRSAASPAA